MFFVLLAADYDGTLAREGHVDVDTIRALEEVRRSGRKLLLLTGRDLADLRNVFDRFDLFDLVVAENGGVLLDPLTREETLLTDPPSTALVARLRQLGVSPLRVGRTIVSTWEPNESTVLRAIRDLGLELHIVFNKGAVMVLPSGVNKASGLRAALKRLQLSAHNVVGIGDAENDQTFLAACGCAVAVENAVPAVKQNADLVLGDHARGVSELVGLLTRDDLASVLPRERRDYPAIGKRPDSSSVTIGPSDTVLVTGASGAGKSTVVTALLEQMSASRFQFCIVDPEGDYSELPNAIVVGDAKQHPSVREVMALLREPATNVVINLLEVDAPERPRYLAGLVPELAKLRADTGRPHWIVVDELHHCLPPNWDPALATLPRELPAANGITVHPEEVAPEFLALVSTVIGVGRGAGQSIAQFCRATGRILPYSLHAPPTGQGWLLGGGDEPELVTVVVPRERQKRHVRKYAQGELGEDKSFYFRGPDGALNLRAHNLSAFVRLAEGVDERTWLHHLHQGAYSRWFREAIKDEELAREAAVVEGNRSIPADLSRARIRGLIERRYTLPAKQGRASS